MAKSPDQPTYSYGTSVDLTPTPSAGYHFVDWTGDASGSANPLTVIMDGAKSITANFAINTYTISGTVMYGATGLPGVTMMGLPGDPITNGSGFYSVIIDHGFDTIVTPTLAGYAFIPASVEYIDVAANQEQNYTATHPIPALQRAALVALYDATGGESWTTKTGWKDGTLETDGFGPIGSENTWYGVTTGGANTYVTGLNLNGNNLVGTLPSSLSNLTNLASLQLQNNHLTGTIPDVLGSLSNLQTLRLDFNQLSGAIPATLQGLSQLLGLYLGTNQLTGAVPTWLGDLTGLTTLDLSNNQLSGTIPTELGTLVNLWDLYLDRNQLSGGIPTQLGSLTKLRYLFLNKNHLNGSIPAQLQSLTNLLYLLLSDNHFSGTIPDALGNLQELRSLTLNGNMLVGPIPTTLINLTNLTPTGLDLAFNSLYASDPGLLTFLGAMDPDWTATQTIAPSGVTATARDGGTIRVSWTAIPYAGHTGYYAVYRSETPGGPYTLAGQTANKTLTSFDVSGLTVGQRYYFVVLTHTDAHSNNQNPEDSGYSLEATSVSSNQANVRITGSVLLNGSAPLANVAMSGLPGTIVTDGSGIYDVTVAAGWTGTVTPSLTGYTFEPASIPYADLAEDQTGQGYTATDSRPIVISVTSPSPNGAFRPAWRFRSRSPSTRS